MRAKYPRLVESEVKSIVDQGVLFLGTGDKASIPVLLSHAYRVLCVDLAERPLNASSVDWLRADVRTLDFSLLMQSFDTVVLQRLCDKESRARFPYVLLDSLVGFDNILIEFCDNPEHYDFNLGDRLLSCDADSMRSLADHCDVLLQEAGYDTCLASFNRVGDLYLKLAASTVKKPLFFTLDVADGFFNPGFPPGYWDGNYYD
ncbi:hypothetical protein GF352_03005 [archaeon]|nr:hypothetical protein [archaeon]